jgi:hypothetical protein
MIDECKRDDCFSLNSEDILKKLLTETNFYVAYPPSYDLKDINCSVHTMEIYFTNDTGKRELFFTFLGSNFKLNKNYNECQLVVNMSIIDMTKIKG